MRYLILIILFLTLFFGSFYSQQKQVKYNGDIHFYSMPGGGNVAFTTKELGPNGTKAHKYLRGCELIKATEMVPYSKKDTLKTLGFPLCQGTDTNVRGRLTIYLLNSSDQQFKRGNSWEKIISGMQLVYSNTLTIPKMRFTEVLACDHRKLYIDFYLTNTFQYKGNNIYIAWDWQSYDTYGKLEAEYPVESFDHLNRCFFSSDSIKPPLILKARDKRLMFRFGI